MGKYDRGMIFPYLVCAFVFVNAYVRKLNLKSDRSNKDLLKLLKGNKDFCDHTFNTCKLVFHSNKHDEKLKFLLDTQLVNNLSKILFSFQHIIEGTKTEEATSSETQRREGGGKEKKTNLCN